MEKMNLELKKKIYQEYCDGVSIQGLAIKYHINFSNLRYFLKLIEMYGWDSYVKTNNCPTSLKQELINKVLNKEDSLFNIALSGGLKSRTLLHGWVSNYIKNGYNIVERKRGRKTMPKVSKKRSKETIESLQNAINLEWTYNSNGIEGNTLTLKETKVVLEGITIGGKSVKEHLEAINHENAIEYLEELTKDKSEISEWNIKVLHQLVLKGIDDDNAGRYRNHNVIISGAQHRPPEYIKVPELMEKLMMNYDEWDKYHSIIRAALLHGELVKIHPFIDGNGRTSRLIMNMELMRSGYVPVIIKKDDRLKYYEALDKAHTTGDYTDFVKLVTKEENEMLDRYLEIIK